MGQLNICLLLLLCQVTSMLGSMVAPIHFWLYTMDNLEEYEDMQFDGSKVHLSPDTMFDTSKPTKLVAHGWGGGMHIDRIFAGAYARAGLDYNVVGVDWRDMEGTAQEQVVMVGVYAAHFVQALVLEYGLKLDAVHPIGWSYGAHVVANIGKEINRGDLGKLARITVLDPGEYGFYGAEHQHLIISKEDAEYVDVIHTDALAFGFLRPLGHADFYPNGGSSQPCTCDHPCPDVDCHAGANNFDKNDHARAPAYFEESILSQEKFPAWKCKNTWLDFLSQGSCSFETDSFVANMGEWSTGRGVPEEGIYFLTTRGQSPYSCEEEECFTN